MKTNGKESSKRIKLKANKAQSSKLKAESSKRIKLKAERRKGKAKEAESSKLKGERIKDKG